MGASGISNIWSRNTERDIVWDDNCVPIKPYIGAAIACSLLLVVNCTTVMSTLGKRENGKFTKGSKLDLSLAITKREISPEARGSRDGFFRL